MLWGVEKEYHEDEDVDDGPNGDYKNEEHFFSSGQILKWHHVDLVNWQLNTCLSVLYEANGHIAVRVKVFNHLGENISKYSAYRRTGRHYRVYKKLLL